METQRRVITLRNDQDLYILLSRGADRRPTHSVVFAGDPRMRRAGYGQAR